MLLTLGAELASAQSQGATGGIYTCVDRNGRRLTADRPIPECLDREQRELSPSGITRRQIGPSLTELERAAQDAQNRKDAEERARVVEEVVVGKNVEQREEKVDETVRRKDVRVEQMPSSQNIAPESRP